MSDPLDLLIADGVIDEVLGRLKSGKEANISLVRRGEAVIAAKVYKDRATRSFKNNAEYKEGRKVRNTRTQRAMDSGGQFGREAAEQAWKSAEADALYRLAGTGVRAPAPVMFYEGVLLMDLVVDADGRPAPRLIDVVLDPQAALGVYADLVAQLIAMLCCDLIHGDLSPYNILASADGPTIIDFPQVISAAHSSRAEFYFLRDFDNVVRYVSAFDPSLAIHAADGRAIWRAYVSRDLTPEFVPPPPPPPRAARSRDERPRGAWNDGRGRGRDDRGGGRPNGPPRGDGRSWAPGPGRNGNSNSNSTRTNSAEGRGPAGRSDNNGPGRTGPNDPRRGSNNAPGGGDNSGPGRGGNSGPGRGGNSGPGRNSNNRQWSARPQANGNRADGGAPNRGDNQAQARRDPRPVSEPRPPQGASGSPRRDGGWTPRASSSSRPSDAAPPNWSEPRPPRIAPPPPSRGGRRRPKRRF